MFSSCKKHFFVRRRNERAIKQSRLFDARWYRNQYPEIQKQKTTPLADYITHWESKSPSPLFDTPFYLTQCKEMSFSTRSPLLHYLEEGWLQGLNPTPLFDSQWYARVYAGVLQGRPPLEHYAIHGNSGDFDPSTNFSSKAYLDFNPDVKAGNHNPLWHYLAFGKKEGRSDTHSQFTFPESETLCRIDFLQDITAGDDILLYVAYCPDSHLSGLQLQCVQKYIEKGFSVILVANTNDVSRFTSVGVKGLKGAIVRDNIGFDFGAWRHACELIDFKQAHSVTFTNDSVLFIPPDSLRFLENIQQKEGDVIFMTKNHEIHEHCQSYFFTLKDTALTLGGLDVLKRIPYYTSKTSLIKEIEVNLSSSFQNKGLTVNVLFAPTQYENFLENLTIKKWDELIDMGYPFIKIQLFTQRILTLTDSATKARFSSAYRRLIEDHLLIREPKALKKSSKIIKTIKRLLKRISS